MPIAVSIGAQDYTAGPGYYTDLTSLKVSEDVINNTFELDFDVVIANMVIPRPKSNVEVVVMSGAFREYAGVIATIQQELVSPDIFRFICKATGFKIWFDRHMVVEAYPQQPASDIVKQIVSSFCDGFTVNNVQLSPPTGILKEDYRAPSIVIHDLANILAWNYYVDYDKDVHFYESESIQGPLPNNTLYLDTDLDTFSDMQMEENGSQVKNRIICKGFRVKSSVAIPIHIVADGNNTAFPLPAEPAGTTVAYFPELQVGPIAFTPVPDIASGMPGVPGPAGNTNAYIHQGNRTIRFDVAPASGTLVSGSMFYNFPPVYVEDDPTAIQEEATREGTDGVYEYAVQDPRMTSDDTSLAQARAGFLIAKYATQNITGKFKSFYQGWQAGQYFYLVSNKWMDGINKKVYVAKVDKVIVEHLEGGDPIFEYTITFSDRPYIF